jgi:hypothetical protein
MLDAEAAFDRHRGDIRPDVVELFSRFGKPLIETYAGRGLFHVTHSAFLEPIMAEGLVPGADVVEPEDVHFLAGAYMKHAHAAASERVRFLRTFMNYDRAREDIERGVFLFPFPPTFSSMPQDFEISYNLHGGPKVMRHFLRNIRYLAEDRHQFEEGERANAKTLLDGYVEKLATGQPALVVLEVDPFSPAVINSRDWGNRSDPMIVSMMETARAFEIARDAIGENPNRVEVRNELIPPKSISVVGSWPISPKAIAEDARRMSGVIIAPGHWH